MSYARDYLDLEDEESSDADDSSGEKSLSKEYENLDVSVPPSAVTKVTPVPVVGTTSGNKKTQRVWYFAPDVRWLSTPKKEYYLLTKENGQERLNRMERRVEPSYRKDVKLNVSFDMDALFQVDRSLELTNATPAEQTYRERFNEYWWPNSPLARTTLAMDTKCQIVQLLPAFLSGPGHTSTSVTFKNESTEHFKEFHYNFASTLIPRLLLWIRCVYYSSDQSKSNCSISFSTHFFIKNSSGCRR